MAIFAAAVLANEDTEIVIVNDFLVFLTETPPFGFGRLGFQILLVDYVDFELKFEMRGKRDGLRKRGGDAN